MTRGWKVLLMPFLGLWFLCEGTAAILATIPFAVSARTQVHQSKGGPVESDRTFLGVEKHYYIENGAVFYSSGDSPGEPLAADAATFRAFDLTPFAYKYAKTLAADKNGFFVQKNFIASPNAHTAEVIFPYNDGNAICMVRVAKKIFLIDQNEKRLKELKTEGDPSQFRALPTGVSTSESRYFVDSKFAYFLEPYKYELTKLDVDDLEKFNPSAFRDGDQVYRFKTSKGVYQGSKILPGADPATFKFGSMGYGFDRDHVYWLGGGGWPVEGADLATFHELRSSEDGFDAEDKNQSYRSGRPAKPFRRNEDGK
jgi:hypothetical protein